MAKPIRGTPPVKGRDAVRIIKEIREGTPRTPNREETLQRAARVFRESTEKSNWVNR